MRVLSLLMVLAGASVFFLPSAAQDMAASRLERILTSKNMRVCIWPDYYSITYRNPKTQS